MEKKSPPLSKNEIVILTIILGLGIVLVFSLGWLSLSLRKPKIPSFASESNVQSSGKTSSSLEEKQFSQILSQLTTSQEILDYLRENLIFEEGKPTELFSPKEIFEKKKGNSFELAIFTTYLLWFQRYNSSIIKYKTEKGRENTVVVFRDRDLPKTIVFTLAGPVMYHHGWSFEEMFQKEEERLGEKIKEYALFYWSDEGKLLPEKEEWIKR